MAYQAKTVYLFFNQYKEHIGRRTSYNKKENMEELGELKGG